jgi:hypothetical protein
MTDRHPTGKGDSLAAACDSNENVRVNDLKARARGLVVPVGEAEATMEVVIEETATDERGLRFDDPYWDDAFCAWWDPALRTCC